MKVLWAILFPKKLFKLYRLNEEVWWSLDTHRDPNNFYIWDVNDYEKNCAKLPAENWYESMSYLLFNVSLWFGVVLGFPWTLYQIYVEFPETLHRFDEEPIYAIIVFLAQLFWPITEGVCIGLFLLLSYRLTSPNIDILMRGYHMVLWWVAFKLIADFVYRPRSLIYLILHETPSIMEP